VRGVRPVTERWAYSAVARCGTPLPTIGGVDGDPRSPTKSDCVACAALVSSGRPLVERPPSEAPGSRSVPPDDDLPAEVAELAALLAEVVELAEDRAVFPSRLQVIAELATEHDSVRQALATNGTAS
jgi:hypothetical protein